MALRPQHVTSELLNKVTKGLGITALDQWYYVSHHVAKQVIGSRVLNDFGGSLASFLQYAYPQHHFDEDKLSLTRKLERDQKFVEVIIRKLFPNTKILTKARKAVGIVNPETNEYLEIDFWIPSLKLGIEYQDKHHYEYQWYAHGSLEDYQKRDEIKKVSMSTLGYTLITIGYWWDKSIESIAATIRKFRPDLLQEYATSSTEPIPSDPPIENIAVGPGIPGVSGIMNPFIPSYKFDPTNWYGGEKHDGIRGIYNPKLQKMFSRSGNELSVLPSLLKDIPGVLLEGEIIAGRGNYNKTAAVSYHIHHEKVDWPAFRYVVFDIPDSAWENYTQRYSIITTRLLSYPFIFAQLAFRLLLACKTLLKMLLDAIISDAGEGVIVQQDARYEYGRAKGLAKIKVRRDADAQVLSFNKNSCICKLVSGVNAEITFSDGFDARNVKIGDVISYYHNGFLQSGRPNKGEIYKVRYDATWEQLINDKARYPSNSRSVKEITGGSSLIARNIARNERGHWNKLRNVRSFLDAFARTAGFDPLLPENWYAVRGVTLYNAGGGGLLKSYSGNLKKAVSHAYPELRFEAEKFITHKNTKGNKMERHHWNKSTNVRTFFDNFAQTMGFDQLVPNNWYSVRHSTLHNAGGGGLLTAFRFNIPKALSYAYPELKFEDHFRPRDKKKARNKGYWRNQLNIKAFFDEFARRNGFDPLDPEQWFAVRQSSLINAKGIGLLKSYDFNLKKALSCAYPEMKLDSQAFRNYKRSKT